MLLSETSINTITSKLPSNYTQVYNKLQTLLSKEQQSFFARPDIVSSRIKWSSDIETSKPIRSFQSLSAEEKDEVADYLEKQEKSIKASLKNDNEIKRFLDNLFLIPSEASIKVITTEKGLIAVLTEWGSVSNTSTSEINPVSMLINRPRSTTSRVVVKILYTDGTVASDKVFYYRYAAGNEIPSRANQDGIRDFGRFKIGSEFKIFDKVNGLPVNEHTFTVSNDDEYLVYFPLYTKATLKVIDQKDRIVSDLEVGIKTENNQNFYKTDARGVIELDNLEVGKQITAFEKGKSENVQTYTIEKEDNNFVLRVFQEVSVSLIVEVLDEENEIQFHYPVLIEYNGTETEYDTQAAGEIRLSSLEENKTVRIIDKNKIDNFVTHTLQEGKNKVQLKIIKPQKQFVRVLLINHKDEPIPAIPIDFAYQKETVSKTTDEKGICVLAHEDLVDGEKIKTKIYLSNPSKKDKDKKRVIKKNFVFDAGVLDYTIKLKKRRYWWLLWFLLLLPLLLLISCEKTVLVKTLNSESNYPVEGANVSFAYNQAFLFDFQDNTFLKNQDTTYRDSTNNAGVTEFVKLRYSVFSYIFKFYSPAYIQASHGCYVSDTLSTSFHRIWNTDTLTLLLHPKYVSLDFKVVDKEDNEPLVNATVSIIAEFNGKQYADTVLSEADGRVVFPKIPECGKVVEIIASLKGYQDDKITNKKIEELFGSIDSVRTLKLIPLKERLVFFIVDCQSKEPIPEAKATIDLELANKNKSYTSETNVNGVGKGEFEDAYTIAEVMISAERKYYKKGSLPKKYKVEDFVKLSKEERTFCLEPEDQCAEFTNTDKETGEPLAGVKNIIKIDNNGKITYDTLISNKNGKFTFCSIVGDKVSMVSTYPPNYVDNEDQIKDQDGISLIEADPSKRIIPLTPILVELTFRTVELEDLTTLVPNADLIVTVNGRNVSPTTSGNGEFVVKAFSTAVISIVASKKGYRPNSTKIKNELVTKLQTYSQDKRNIPLEDLPKPCLEPPVQAGTFEISIESYDMKDNRVNFAINYDFVSQPDRMIIYCGQGTNGKVIYSSGGYISGTGKIPISMSICTNTTWITIEVEGKEEGTSWSYVFECN
jgi:hypothetical protein